MIAAKMVNAIGSTLASCFQSLGGPFYLNPPNAAASLKPSFCPAASSARGSAGLSLSTPPPSLQDSPKAGGRQLTAAALDQICRKLKAAVLAILLPKLCVECRAKVAPALKRAHAKNLTLGCLCSSCRALFRTAKSVTEGIQRGTRTEPMPRKVLLRLAQSPRLDQSLSLFQALTAAGIPWCRYCGTTESQLWRPGPWGPETLCKRHGCGYVGFDTSAGHARLDLSAFARETTRERPIIKSYCASCWSGTRQAKAISCAGCAFAYHRACVPGITQSSSRDKWYCRPQCQRSFDSASLQVSLPLHAALPFDRHAKRDSATSRQRDDEKPVGTSCLYIPITPPSKKRRCDSSPALTATAHPAPVIAVPVWRKSAPADVDSVFSEDIRSAVYLHRHSRYEVAEKDTRILRPSVLDSLRITTSGRGRKTSGVAMPQARRHRAKSC